MKFLRILYNYSEDQDAEFLEECFIRPSDIVDFVPNLIEEYDGEIFLFSIHIVEINYSDGIGKIEENNAWVLPKLLLEEVPNLIVKALNHAFDSPPFDKFVFHWDDGAGDMDETFTDIWEAEGEKVIQEITEKL